MVRPGGFEPPTTWFVARYSIQLSYGRSSTFGTAQNGAPGRIRTSDHLVRSQVLYPAELRALTNFCVLLKMVRPGGFEPPTTWFVARYSIQLSYGRKWRRRGDSNPRCGYKPHTPLAGERLQPLGHLSVCGADNTSQGFLVKHFFGEKSVFAQHLDKAWNIQTISALTPQFSALQGHFRRAKKQKATQQVSP